MLRLKYPLCNQECLWTRVHVVLFSLHFSSKVLCWGILYRMAWRIYHRPFLAWAWATFKGDMFIVSLKNVAEHGASHEVSHSTWETLLLGMHKSPQLAKPWFVLCVSCSHLAEYEEYGEALSSWWPLLSPLREKSKRDFLSPARQQPSLHSTGLIDCPPYSLLNADELLLLLLF